MCVISGYIGKEAAAPILLEMLRREEGFAGGYYTGIATIHEGRLYHHKLVGDITELIRVTEAQKLPGSIGIAHSRTPDGGDSAWAHPFVDRIAKLAYIANGTIGRYADLVDFAKVAEKLILEGHSFGSARDEPISRYPRLRDGKTVHFSDIMCQSIAQAFCSLEGNSCRLLRAAMGVYEKQPGELAGLCLHAEHPDEIVAVRHNKPMEVAMDETGAIYLASASLAFPKSASWRMRMPAQSGAIFRRSGSIEIRPFTSRVLPVGREPSPMVVERLLTNRLRNKGPHSVRQLIGAVNEYWSKDVLTPKESVVYEALAALVTEGKVALENRLVPGMHGIGTAPQTWVRFLP